MRHMPLPLLNSLMTRSGFEGGLRIRFCVCSRNSVMLVE